MKHRPPNHTIPYHTIPYQTKRLKNYFHESRLRRLNRVHASVLFRVRLDERVYYGKGPFRASGVLLAT